MTLVNNTSLVHLECITFTTTAKMPKVILSCSNVQPAGVQWCYKIYQRSVPTAEENDDGWSRAIDFAGMWTRVKCGEAVLLIIYSPLSIVLCDKVTDAE